MSMVARQILVLLLVMALAAAGYYLLTPSGRQLIDRTYINWTRADYLARFRAGERLPGTPDLARLDERLSAHGAKLGVPVYVRIFKLESELELWIEKPIRSADGRDSWAQSSKRVTGRRLKASTQ
jgi:hypothetical protein